MIVKSSTFIVSNTDYINCPAPDLPEYAFIGRSNVGKSSLINMLCANKHLAKVSGKPGKTQLINHFLINEEWYLVDLPGYGWAKVSKEKKEQWEGMIKSYLINRENLLNVFLLIDIRIEPQTLDIEFMNWMGQSDVPFSIVFTKADKLTKNKVNQQKANYLKHISQFWEEPPQYFVSSTVTSAGKEEILKYIDTINKEFKS